jgi:spore coat protein U-like protein
MNRAVLPISVVLMLGGLVGFLLSRYAEAAVFVVSCKALSSTLTLNSPDPLNAPNAVVNTPTGSITVSCTSDHSKAVTVDYTLQLNTTTARTLTSGANTISYDVYTDSATSIPWGTTGTCTAGLNTNNGNVICGSYSVPAASTATQIKNYYAKFTTAANMLVGTYTQSPAIGVTMVYSCNPAPTGKGTC